MIFMNKKNEVLTNLELSSFCKQMSMILKAGISPIEGISMMIDDFTITFYLSLLNTSTK